MTPTPIQDPPPAMPLPADGPRAPRAGKALPPISPRALPVLFAVVVGLCLIGFAAGTRRGKPVDNSDHSFNWPDERVPAARSYTDLRDDPLHPNPSWPATERLLRLQAEAEPPRLRTPDEIRAARAARRAYDGAPPVIPHPIAQRDAGACLACHGDGVPVNGRIASTMSHEFRTQCTQCHAPSAGTGLAGESLPLPADGPRAPRAMNALLADSLNKNGTYGENRFIGGIYPGQGARASLVAPPVIPHPTFMRETCMACHGPSGNAPIKSTHPERQSCQQCHAPSAALDQREGR